MPITLNPGVGGASLNTETVGGVDTQIVKIGFSTPNTAPSQVNLGNPMPVQGTVAVSAISNPVTVAGSVTIAGVASVSGSIVGANVQDAFGKPVSAIQQSDTLYSLRVAVVGANGAQITSFGGAGGTAENDGTAYTRGTTPMTPVGGVVDAAAPTLTAGQAAGLSIDTQGALRVNVIEGGAASGTAGAPSTDVLTVQGAVGMTALATSNVPGIAPGTTKTRIVSGASTNATLLKNAAGVLLGFGLYNNTASMRYVKFFDLSILPVPGTSIPAFVVILNANGGANIDIGASGGLPFVNGIGYCITGGSGLDTDSQATGTADVQGFVLTK